MSIKRRTVLTGSAAGMVSLTSGLAAPAIAQSDPIRIGYLPALTGPSSSTGVGINRGAMLAVEYVEDRVTKEPAPGIASRVAEEAAVRGLLLLKAGIHSNCNRVLCPLVLTDAELEDGLGAWEEALEAFLA